MFVGCRRWDNFINFQIKFDLNCLKTRRRRRECMNSSLNLNNHRNIIPNAVKPVKRKQKKSSVYCTTSTCLIVCLPICVALIVLISDHDERSGIIFQSDKRWTVVYEDGGSFFVFFQVLAIPT